MELVLLPLLTHFERVADYKHAVEACHTELLALAAGKLPVSRSATRTGNVGP